MIINVNSWQCFSFVYLFSPFAFEGGGWRTVWLSSMSTTHFVLSSISARRSLLGESEAECGGVKRQQNPGFSSDCVKTALKPDYQAHNSSWEQQWRKESKLYDNVAWMCGDTKCECAKREKSSQCHLPLRFMGRTLTATFTFVSDIFVHFSLPPCLSV